MLSTLRSQPGQVSLLFRLSVLAVALVLAWDVFAGHVMPLIAVKAGLAIMLLAYGCTVTMLITRAADLTRRWESVAALTGRRSSGGENARGVDPRSRDTSAEDANAPASEQAEPSVESELFNESYFMLRLQEQVKDARRAGHEMCVVAVEITVPGREITPQMGDRIAYEMACIAAAQSRVMGQPLSVSESEYIFSLPATGAADTKVFVREIVQALGDYWCHFGIAAFPQDAGNAEALVEKARAACDASSKGGKKGSVTYA